MKRDPGLYDYLPYDRRPKITWPNGANVAFWVAPNIEFYEIDPPRNATRISWPRPVPDVLGYASRDYGNRAGFWRLAETLDRCGVRASVSLNAAVCHHHPEVIKACAERGWEFFSHGIYNTRYLFEMSEAQEREVIQDSIDTIADHTGRRPDGWLAPALTYTERTLDLVAELGFIYACDLFHDDQPCPLKTKRGRLASIPYSIEMNDVIAFNIATMTPRAYGEILRRQFDHLYMEGAESGTVMCIPLHPFIIGHPYRLAAFEEALAYITGHDKVWLTTGREIARHFLTHDFDAFTAASERVGEAP